MYGRAFESIYQKVLFEYMDKFPAAPTRMIARMLVRDHPDLFPKLESTRDRVRYYRGKQGTKNRQRVSTNKYITDAKL